jgi:plasmid stabilization system protein ParE
MTYRLRIAREVVAQAAAVEEWWRANRPKAPDLFREELTAALERLESAPLMSQRYPTPEQPDARRLLMPRTRYFLYFTIEERIVVVRALWHAARGVGPSLE